MSETEESAGRCIRLIRPHRWSRWRLVEGTTKTLFVSGTTTFQTRSCVRCGRTQVDDVSAT